MSLTDTLHMIKTLCMLVFTVFVAFALAEDSTMRDSANKLSVKKSLHVDKSTKAYKTAKEACLGKSEDLKGKKLTDCIVEYQKAAK